MSLRTVAQFVSRLGLLLPRGMRENVFRYVREKRTEFLPDRKYLRKTLLPALAARRPRRLLNVGVKRYNDRDARVFQKVGCEYWTTDIAPEAARHGPKARHVVADVRLIDRHFEPGYFDVILLNGVFGHGLNDIPGQNQAIAALWTLLTPGGVLLIGWNQGLSADPLELEAVKTHFTHEPIQNLRARSDFRRSNHTFDLFLRRNA